MPDFVPTGMGWFPDLPDPRDTSPRDIENLFTQSKVKTRRNASLPSHVDLRFNGQGKDEAQYFPNVDDQMQLNSSAALACISVLRYFQRRTTGQICEISSLFLYKTALLLRNAESDSGIDLRTTLKAMKRFGVPPEKQWPYQPPRFDVKPNSPWLYGYASEFQDIFYVRLDQPKMKGTETLQTVKQFLVAGFPVLFGFAVPSSISQLPDIPFRPSCDAIRGGQAVVATGYDNLRTRATKGALLIRNSWGNDWGDKGYGWLPYAYVEEKLASCFWVIVHPKWLESGEFYSPFPKKTKRQISRKRPPNSDTNGKGLN